MARAVIQAGGQGMRLRPYTTVLPKPLMPVGDLPILEIVIRQLVRHGFDEITITLGHLAGLIMAVVGDGRSWGASVEYVQEEHPLGTIGPVALADGFDEPFIVMNGDLLTDFDYGAFMKQHVASGVSLSVGVYEKPVPISLGVFDLNGDGNIKGFREKPTLSFHCSAGIYAFHPETVDLIPSGEPFGFDDLMAVCLAKGIDVGSYIHEGLWFDVGRKEDYEDASRLLEEHRCDLLPELEQGRCPEE